MNPIMKKKIINSQTAYNRTVTASPPSAARLPQNTSRAFSPLWCFAPAHFFAPVKMLRIFPHRAQKNVSYSLNVTQHFFTHTVIHRSAPSLARGFYSKWNKEGEEGFKSAPSAR